MVTEEGLTCPVQLVMTCGHIKEGQSVARCPVQWHCTVALYSGIVQWHCTVSGGCLGVSRHFHCQPGAGR